MNLCIVVVKNRTIIQCNTDIHELTLGILSCRHDEQQYLEHFHDDCGYQSISSAWMYYSFLNEYLFTCLKIECET